MTHLVQNVFIWFGVSQFFFYGAIPKIILHFPRNPRFTGKKKKRSVGLINPVLPIAGQIFPRYIEKYLDFLRYFTFFCIYRQVFAQPLKIICLTLEKSYVDRDF
jgi:hypothetical protein